MIEMDGDTAVAAVALVFTLVVSFARLVDERWAARLRLGMLLGASVSVIGTVVYVRSHGIVVPVRGGERIVSLPLAVILLVVAGPWLLRVIRYTRIAVRPDPLPPSRGRVEKVRPIIQSHVALGEWLENPDEAARYRGKPFPKESDGA